MPRCFEKKEAYHFNKLTFFTDIMTQMTAIMDEDWISTPVEYEAITGTGFQTSQKRGKSVPNTGDT